MSIINLTPHAISLQTAEGEVISFPPSGEIARVSSTPGILMTVPGIPVPVASPTVFGEVTGLPAPQKGVFFLVSGMVGAALRGSRTDVLMPGTGPADGAIRNDKGHIVAVTRLIQA
jgi:hypothetical protein